MQSERGQCRHVGVCGRRAPRSGTRQVDEALRFGEAVWLWVRYWMLVRLLQGAVKWWLWLNMDLDASVGDAKKALGQIVISGAVGAIEVRWSTLKPQAPTYNIGHMLYIRGRRIWWLSQ
jgi:hypothetical protein